MSSASQPDYIRKVALIGGTGQIGSHFLKHLLATNKHTITVLTRPDSKATLPSHDNLTVTKVDHSSESSLVDALRGHDFLIVTLSVRVPPTLHAHIVKAAAKAGVPYIMPNYYAYSLGARAGTLNEDPILGRFSGPIKDVADVGATTLSYMAMVCGFWYEYSLASGESRLGINIAKRTVTLFDEGTRKISMSTWEQCGRAVAALLSLPTKDAKPALDDWKNAGIYVSSFLISQRDMLDSLNRVLGTSDADWTIGHQKIEERHAEGLAQMKAGDREGYAKAMYARLFFPSGEGDFETGQELDNAKLGLPKEDLDEATKKAVEMHNKALAR